MSSFLEMYTRPIILAILCFLIFNISTVIYKFRLTVQGISYFFFCHDKTWPEQPDPATIFAPITENTKENEMNSSIEKKTLIFVRHGESTWNDTFNKGSHRSALAFAIGFIPGLIKSLLYESYLLLSGKIDSWFYDSPLSHLGLSQVKSLAQFLNNNQDLSSAQSQCQSLTEDERLLLRILRHDPKSPPSRIVSSNLRRALSTVAAAFQGRLLRDPQESILILPCLQEISRNPDTLSITPAQTKVKPSWIEVSSDVCDFSSIFTKQVDMQYHLGNKPIDTNGLKRMVEFNQKVFSSTLPEDYIIVGGHSIWFRSFFTEFLPRDSDHVGKKKKIVNCGAVALDLWKTTTDDGRHKFMIDEKSIRIVYGGFK